MGFSVSTTIRYVCEAKKILTCLGLTRQFMIVYCKALCNEKDRYTRLWIRQYPKLDSHRSRGIIRETSSDELWYAAEDL